MRRFKRVMMMTTAIGSIGLTGAGIAQAAECDGEPPHATVDNAQYLDCDQNFKSGLITINAPVTVLGESVTNVGNFCTLVGPNR
ncbi:hypothetical protein [Streptomyces sp. NPDC050287]|uniref:hypothetical protein n=1 Tax=Streptomyces sp. NPDC050287 TaxID=3365608 RepID=UPI0037A8BF1A